MRNAVLALLAAFSLGGCVSILDSMYDEEARSNCAQESNSARRSGCYDRVEEHRRQRERGD